MVMDLRQRGSWLAHLLKAATQQHHKELIPLFAPLVPRDAVVLDVGAHAGQFAKLFAKMAPEGRVYAFEPSAYARSILGPALRWNAIANVVVVTDGLSDQPGEAVLQTPITRKGHLGFGRAHVGAREEAGAVAQTIRLTTLDAFAEAQGLARLDFIKADVEGWELNVLKGGVATLKRFHPALFLEVSDDWLGRAGAAPQDLWALLTPLGYRAFKSPGREPAPAYAAPSDYLFLVE